MLPPIFKKTETLDVASKCRIIYTRLEYSVGSTKCIMCSHLLNFSIDKSRDDI